MKIIYNNILPFKGFKCVNLFGVLFARKGANISEIVINHESIHTAQMKEMLYIFFYLWYVIEWIVRLIQVRDTKLAYRAICFEREAYSNEDDENYLKERKHYSSFGYIK